MAAIVEKSRSFIARFLATESSGGIILMVAAALALGFANAPGLRELYEWLLAIPIEIKLGQLELKKNFLLIVNDGLMAVFFLLVGLEIKREVLEGELSSRAQVLLPAVAAVGGVALPALIYTGLNYADATAMRGWAIPAATDIAFSLGVLSLLGTRVPLGLKVFLTAVAIVDDLAAIVIIALFYTDHLSLVALGLGAVGAVGSFALNLSGVSSRVPYLLLGLAMWVCMVKSGVHATLAGVIVGFAIPISCRRDPQHSPLRDLEHKLHPWVAYMILPVFAFANSGVSFAGVTSDAFLGGVSLGTALGLIIGKPLGILAFTLLAVRLLGARLPQGGSWASMAGIGVLCGIGFTMSLFIGTLAFENAGAQLAVAVRVGVFGGSIVSALLGLATLALVLPRGRPAEQTNGL